MTNTRPAPISPPGWSYSCSPSWSTRWRAALSPDPGAEEATDDLAFGPTAQAADVPRTRPAPLGRKHRRDGVGDGGDGARPDAAGVVAGFGNRQGVQGDY